MEMKKILSLFILLILTFTTAAVAEKVNIEKQLIGIVGAVSGKVSTQSRELKTGDKIYLNETIFADKDSGTQILLLDQSTFTIGSESEVVMDTFIYDPNTNDGKIVASVKQGSLKVISGLISKKNPDSLTVKVPEGTLGSRGTEFQTMVSKKQTSTLLIGPGKNNTLGLRPGAVLVGNKLGSTLLNNPYNITTMQKGKAPDQAKKITKGQLKKFNKKMKALKVAKLEGASKEEKKQIKKEIEREEKKNKKDNKATKENKKAEKGKNKTEVKDVVRKQTIKKKDGTVIQQVTVINPKTKKFRRLQKITDKDGKVSYKESKGKVKKVKPKKVAKKKKISKKKKAEAKKKTKGNKGKAAAKKKKDNKKKATTSGNSGNKKKATNKKNNKKKKATNKKNNNKKKATNKKNNNKKKATKNNNKKKKPKPKVKKKPTPKKKAKPKPKVKKPPPKKKKINKAKKVTKKKVKKNKKKAKKKRNKK